MREVLRLSREIKGSSLHLEAAIERIEAFSHLMGARGAQQLGQQVWTLFAAGSPDLGLWVVLDDGHLVGHLLVLLTIWDQEPVGWVTQAQLDDGLSLGEWAPRFLAEMELWAARTNAHYAKQGIKMRTLMMTSFRRSQAWARRFGFQEFRMIYHRPLMIGGEV